MYRGHSRVIPVGFFRRGAVPCILRVLVKWFICIVRCRDGGERPVLRLIVNLIPASACQRCIAGDAPMVPAPGQPNGLMLAPGEQLLWTRWAQINEKI